MIPTADTDPGDTPRDADQIRVLLAEPPPWLDGQIANYKADPDRMRSSICRAIAHQALGETARWPEVAPILEDMVGG